MKREPIISLSVGVYECTEAGGIRNEPRPSVDLSFGPDGTVLTPSEEMGNKQKIRKAANKENFLSHFYRLQSFLFKSLFKV